MSFDAEAHRRASLEGWEEAASGWVRRRELMRAARRARVALDGRGDPPAAGPAGARARRRARRDGDAGRRARRPGRRRDRLRPGRGGCSTARAARAASSGLAQRRVPGPQRGMDRPAARERRRGALPLGLHADGRPRRGARRDAPRAAPRRAARAGGLGRDRGATRGRCCRRRCCASAGSPRRPRSRASRPRSVRARRSRARCASCSRTPASPRSRSTRSSSRAATRASTSFWETTLDLSRSLPRRGARAPEARRSHEIRASSRRGSRRSRADGGLAMPARTLVARSPRPDATPRRPDRAASRIACGP